MWKLTIENDEGARRELDLVRDGYSIGRDATCDVYLHERNVSRRHARLERDAEGCWWLADLGAAYGSFVNGLRVEGRAALAPGHVVQIGDHWLGLVDDEAAEGARAEPTSERTSAPWGVRNEPDRLLVFDGPDDGRQVRLDAGPVLIGVGEGVAIRLPDDVAPPGVYALVRPLPQGRYEIVRRGTAVGMRVRRQPAERALLDDEDVVRFDALDGDEVVAMRFLAARRVRHSSTLTPPVWKAGLGQGCHLDPASLPKLEVIEEALNALPLWWRLEGESAWPRPAGYRSPPVRFTDVTSEPAPAPLSDVASGLEPAPPPDVTGGLAARHGKGRRTTRGRWAAAVAMLALVGGAWALGRQTGDPDASLDRATERRLGASSAAQVIAVAAPPTAAVVQPPSAPSAPPAAGSVASPTAPAPTRPGTSATRVAAPPHRPAPGRPQALPCKLTGMKECDR